MFLPSSSFAQVSKETTLVPVGILGAGSEGETSYYVDLSSIRPKGTQIYYDAWVVWKYEQTSILDETQHWQYTREEHVADCQNWKNGRFNFSSIDKKGRVIATYKDELKMEPPEPDSVGDKSLEVVCNPR